jgi:2-hydroxychromene-2-carboxylate isomerase
MLPRLRARYGAAIEVFLVPPPEDSAAPDRERLRAYGLRDAARLARARGLGFPADAALPAPEAVRRLETVLADALERGRFEEVASAAGAALWSGDARTLAGMAAWASGQDPRLVDDILIVGESRRARLGHYLGGMFHFEGEWFWGVDRLGHLESRLVERGLDREAGTPPLAPALEPSLGAPAGLTGPTIEVWFSFRSPYSWLVLPRIRQLAQAYNARLELRPILPMVMRGLAVPRVKTLYIALDCKREAERLSLPFGTIVDPVGAGAERALAVLHHAIGLGIGEEFAELGLRAAFADGVALAEDRGLYAVARHAGLTDAQTAAALADESWRGRVEANRAALLDAGLWGAPTFRVSGHEAHWGQDRLWMLEDDIRAAMAPARASSQA